MKLKLKDPRICRLLIVLIAFACLGVMTLIGCQVKDANAYSWPYIIFVERPVELSDWESVEDLEHFLEQDKNTLVVVSGEPFNGQCENRAFQLRDNASESGWRIETEILTRAECINYREYLRYDPYYLEENDGHYICKAVVGNEVYFIEPANDKIWLAYYLD